MAQETPLPPDADPAPAEDALRPSRADSGRLRRFGRGRRLLGGFALAILALAALVAALAAWLYSPASALAALTKQINETTGLYFAAQGAPRLTLTPRPQLVLANVAFADRNKALVVEADALVGALKLGPLFLGRLEASSLTLLRPRARVDLDGAPIDAPGAATRAASAQTGGFDAQKADAARLGLLGVVDGALRLRRNGIDYAADHIAATLDWRKVGEHALLTSAFDWRGEKLRLVLWVARPGMFLRGDDSVVTARLDGEALRLEAQGVAQSGPNPRFYGHVGGAAGSVRETLSLLDIRAPLPGPFGDAEFSAQATLTAHDAALREAHVVVDGNAFDGEIALRDDDGRPHVSGRLTSDFVAVKPMFAETPTVVSPDGWSQKPIDPPDLGGADLDLSVLARHARLGRLTVDDADFTATMRNGALDLSLIDARAYRGRVSARASFVPAGGALAMHMTAQTSAVDARALFWDAFGKDALGGRLDATATLDAKGDTVTDMLRSLEGRGALNLADGEIAGVDFDRALRRFEKRPLLSAQDIRSGSSALTRASVAALVDKGIASLEDGVAAGPGFAVAFSGSANLLERSLSLKAVAREADAAGAPRDKGLQIAFDLAGPFEELRLAPDPQAFIRRSGAAAPLLPDPPAEPPR
jgi:AsmA protein